MTEFIGGLIVGWLICALYMSRWHVREVEREKRIASTLAVSNFLLEGKRDADMVCGDSQSERKP